jgi:hypothetical protein
MGFKDLRNSVDLKCLEGGNVNGVEWEQFVIAGVFPNGGMMPILLAVYNSLEKVCH